LRLKELVDLCRREFSAAGRGDPHEAEFLVCALTGVPRSRFFLERDRDIGDPSARLRAWIARRAAGEPIQYVLGTWDFYGREFLLSRDTLIPRPETEGLVERIVEAWKGRGRARGLFLDVGTGCGAIAVTLAAELPGATVVASDISAGALAVARGNARRLGVAGRILPLRSDLYSALKCTGRFDVVVSNPPYVSSEEWGSLPAEVRDFEPAGALLAGPDGLSVIRRLVSGASGRLAPGGELWLEIGAAQGDAVRGLSSPGLGFTGLYKDLAGRDRVARWKRE
jgi:release factor glutamine methyltransferase